MLMRLFDRVTVVNGLPNDMNGGLLERYMWPSYMCYSPGFPKRSCRQVCLKNLLDNFSHPRGVVGVEIQMSGFGSPNRSLASIPHGQCPVVCEYV
jgi:hypothetical protein